MTGRNPWAVLGVAEGAPDHEVQSAYRRRVKQTHPDGGGDAGEFIAVVEAVEVLRRARPAAPRRHRPTPYDRWLRPCPPPAPWPSRPAGGPAPSHRTTKVTAPRKATTGGDFAAVLSGELSKARSTAGALC